MSGWHLDALEIEGFRGINNEGDPLHLKFSSNCVNSVFAPNGTGKSSIFDALSFAIRGSVKKLDALPATERGRDYYVNRFHSKKTGVVALTLSPALGGDPITITVTRTPDGKRIVSGPPGMDHDAILASLDRDFVLLDHKTLQSFIDDKAVDRGRSFSGLLGLARYSNLRQELQAIGNTKAFNNHFEMTALTQEVVNTRSKVTEHRTGAEEAFSALTQTPLKNYTSQQDALAKAHNALHQITVLTHHCEGKTFYDIDIEDCLKSVSATEVGDDRKLLTASIQKQDTCEKSISVGPTDADVEALKALAITRDQAVSEIAGTSLQGLYEMSLKVVSNDNWDDKTLCPVCKQQSDHSLIEHLQDELKHYAAVGQATTTLSAEWKLKPWAELIDLERIEALEGEQRIFTIANQRVTEHGLTVAQVGKLEQWRNLLLTRARQRLQKIKDERLALEKRLPPSLVAVTAAIEAGRRLQTSLIGLEKARASLKALEGKQKAIAKVKDFFDKASEMFAKAESAAANRRLMAVQPVCRTMFSAVMFEPIIPALIKSEKGEDLSLSLGEFWSLKNVSAQALLSESYRNAFAVSVYLAAASLYGGTARFVVLDDVTSSFDAGHQFHLMEVIRTRFARPATATGPQVILLSHDTLLEKLFNKNVNQGGWSHQRLEGTARTAVLPQSNAVNRVKEATLRFLNAGQVEDGSLRLRQYLEFKLLEIIGRVQIPVPIDFASDDNKRQVQNSIDAIDAAVSLHQAANRLVLEPAQVTNLALNIAAISGNFLAHYATGSTQAFSAPSLIGVVAAIDNYAECFMFEEPVGSGTKKYYKMLSRKK